MKLRFLFLSLILLTTSCASYIYVEPEEEVVSCPIIEIEQATSEAKFYSSKMKNDESFLYSIDLLGHKTDCKYNSDYSNVRLMIHPTFNIKVNKSLQDEEIFIDYFIAIPKLFPKPEGKIQLTTKTKRPRGLLRFNFTDDVVEVDIPIEDGENPAKYKVFLGLDISIDQFKENKNYK